MEPGTKIITCSTCRGAGQTQIQQGFFAFSQPCHACSGNGYTIPSPCKVVRDRDVLENMINFL